MSKNIESILDAMGLVLPEPAAPLGAYVHYVQTGNLLMISGQGPVSASCTAIKGRLGDGLAIDDCPRAAQICGLNIVARLKTALEGDWDRVIKIVRLNGFINSAPEFTHQPAVLNGASDLLFELFGARGVHSRTAVGVSALPMGWAVEIDAVVEIEGDAKA